MNNIRIEGTGYLDIRNKYLLPLVSSKVSIEKAKFWTTTELILNHATNFSQNNNHYIITFNKDDYFKMIISEIHLFQVKRLHLQKSLKNTTLSSNWEFVTLYYNFFFTAFIFLLFLHKGFVFINDANAQIIGNILNTLSNNICRFDKGNYFFEDYPTTNSNSVDIHFYKSGDNTHEALWKKIPEIIRKEILNKADSDEKTIYNNLNEAIKNYGAAFPSQTRNHFNYTALSAYNDMKNEISFVYKHSNDFIKDFLKIEFNKNDNWEEKAKTVQYYFKIINKLTDSLYTEYLNRGNEKSDFEKYYQSIRSI